LLGADALQTRLWDRFHDQYVALPMQKMVGEYRELFPLRSPADVDVY
jgi:hypothetical protein